jgi:phenylacetate-CoA ligase
MASIELSIVVPCYNEEGNIRLLVERLQQALKELDIPVEIILVDDCSRDRTRLVIEQLVREYPDVVVGQYHPVNQGIVGGWKTGLAAAQGKYVLTTDADLQYRPEDIPSLYNEMVGGNYDLVQGWRREHREMNRTRRILRRGFSLLLNWLFSMRLDDIKSGFVLYRRECFADILHYRMNYVCFQHFITIAAHYKGYRIRQIPVVFDKRHAGDSFIQTPILFSLKALVDLPLALWEYRRLEARQTRLRRNNS